MSGFVYIWKEKKLNKYYIGSHWGLENDGYICSSPSMRKQYKRHPENFNKRRILSRITTNRQDLLNEEQRWLDMIKPEEFGCRYYNISSSVKTPVWWMNAATRQIVGNKISKSLKSTSKKIGFAIKPFSGHTKNSNQKISISLKNYWNNNPQLKEKYSQQFSGPNSPSYKDGKFMGRYKNKIYISQRKGPPHNAIKILYNGQIYNSITEASKENKISSYFIKKSGQQLND